MNGGDRIARVLERNGIPFLFTLCGGHISPILVAAKARGIRVVDVRHEANAVFAADAVARITGRPGVAAVTAGPGATNTVTAVKNAQLAQSPVVLLGGATATVLKGRGSLQDIDQMALFRPHVKWARSVSRVRDLESALTRALRVAQEGVPGPVFLETPVDLLYDEALVRSWYGMKSGGGGLAARALALYLERHLAGVFAADRGESPAPVEAATPEPSERLVGHAARRLARARRPVLVVGSQATLEASAVDELAAAVEALGVPVFLSGMARGLLGAGHRMQMRHRRKQALREADLVILAGVPCDFRLDYGRHISRRAELVSANRSAVELRKNRRPSLAIQGDPGRFLRALAAASGTGEATTGDWIDRLRARNDGRDREIRDLAGETTEHVNPLAVCAGIEARLADDSTVVADGGDFVGTASYIVSPRGPLRWLDPGVFGTLGVGAGFALGAKLCRPDSQVWIVYGDGSVAYSLAEFDTFVRHEVPVVAVVGNDASWAQIAREQVEVLKDDVGTVLNRTDYHRVAEGFGGRGLLLDDPERVDEVLAEAARLATEGHPVLVNALLGATDFRKGSISI